MRICGAFPFAALIFAMPLVAMPLGGMAQAQQFSPPVGGDANLLQGCEIGWLFSKSDWLFSKAESLTGGFEPWLGPKRAPSVAPGPVRPCFEYAAIWDLIRDIQTRDRLVSQTYFSVRNTPTSGSRGDFWRLGELDRLMGPR